MALGRVLRAQLFGVQATDPSVIATMALTSAICGLLAVVWPACGGLDRSGERVERVVNEPRAVATITTDTTATTFQASTL